MMMPAARQAHGHPRHAAFGPRRQQYLIAFSQSGDDFHTFRPHQPFLNFDFPNFVAVQHPDERLAASAGSPFRLSLRSVA